MWYVVERNYEEGLSVFSLGFFEEDWWNDDQDEEMKIFFGVDGWLFDTIDI